jgi:hypothetical protein
MEEGIAKESRKAGTDFKFRIPNRFISWVPEFLRNLSTLNQQTIK